ncbi:MAG: IPT/TIG domain-containing protein [Candidatus Hydrogenedentes bacterium]|nr:IPT/TIG domain-containing protein [Candidatus Hydrogenedentota bacterium]
MGDRLLGKAILAYVFLFGIVLAQSAGAVSVVVVTPNTGSEVGGTSVTIIGLGFDESGTTNVYFGAAPATNVTVLPNATYYSGDETMITCETPPGTGGSVVDVTVVNPDMQSHAKIGAFTYLEPTVTAVSPNVGGACGGTPVAIAGTNFHSGIQILFNGTPAQQVQVHTSSSITCLTPYQGVDGPTCVTATAPDGATSTNCSVFEYGTCDQTEQLPVDPIDGGHYLPPGERLRLRATVEAPRQMKFWTRSAVMGVRGKAYPLVPLDGTVLSNGGNVSGADTAELIIDPVTEGDTGYYWATMEDASGDQIMTEPYQVQVIESAPSASSRGLAYLVAMIMVVGLATLLVRTLVRTQTGR